MERTEEKRIRGWLSDWYEDYDPNDNLYDAVVKAVEYEHKNAAHQEAFGRQMQKEVERLAVLTKSPIRFRD